MDPSSLETDIAALHRLDKGRYRYVTDLYCEKSRHDVRGYFPFAFSPGLRRALANTNFSLTARFRTAASLRFICLAIVTTLAPDNARVRRRSSSYGVQTGPADITSPSPSAGVPVLRTVKLLCCSTERFDDRTVLALQAFDVRPNLRLIEIHHRLAGFDRHAVEQIIQAWRPFRLREITSREAGEIAASGRIIPGRAWRRDLISNAASRLFRNLRARKRSFPRWGIAESANQDFGFAFSPPHRDFGG